MDSETAFRGSSMRLIVRHEQAARAFVWIVAVLIGFAAVAQYITGLYCTGHRRSPWTFASPGLSAQFQGTSAGSLSRLFDGSGQIGHVLSSLTLAQTDQLITQEFRYHAPDAGEVFLVWGVNGWAVVPKRTRPAGTMIKDTVMHTPMGRDGDVFVVKVRVPAGATIDYGFLITKTRSGTTVKVWEANGDQDYHIVAEQDGVLEVQTRLASAEAETSVNAADAPLVSQEIRYHMPEAGEVYLVWGVNGWAVVPEEMRPAGTVMKDEIMHTPMVHEGVTFTTKIQVPTGATLDCGFLITKRRDGATVRIWEGVWEGVNAPAITTPGDIIEVQTRLTLTGDHATLILTDAPLVTQEIRYHMPEAGEVYLVWGVNGWLAMPEETRPAGTVVKEKLMHTPMAHEEGTFSASVQAPAGATIEYSFLITKEHAGADIEALWDESRDYHLIATQDGITEIRSTLSLKKIRRQILSDIGLPLLATIALLVGIGLALRHIPQLSHRRVAVLALIALTLLGLALRLQVARTAHHLLNVPAHLIGDEPRYEYLASALLQGEFFQQPLATPVYPLFLAACYLIFGHTYAPVLYVQAFIGAATIPLTYRLARYFAGRRGSLFAAALIALNQALIGHVGSLLTESLYVFLLLLTLLALLWALKAPLLRRFLLAGGLLGICALLRPAIAFFPAFLPALLPRGWSLRRRAALWVVYGGFMAAVIAPWTYHNYRTYDTFMPFSLSMTMLWHGSPEFYHVMQQKENAITEVWAEELNPARNGGIDPASIEGDRYFTARAIASIRAEPGVYAWYSLQKLLYFWIGHPAATWDWPFNLYKLRTYYSASSITGLLWPRLLLVPAALASLVILRRRLRALAPLLLLCAYHMLIYTILIPVARYSEPLYPILATIVATAASATALHYQSRHQQPVRAAQNERIVSQPGMNHRRKVLSNLSTNSTISVVIPAKNEAAGIVRIIDSVRPFVNEVIVIDGHSTDGTADLARAADAIVYQDNGRGKGAACILGIEKATGQVVVFMDADGSHDAKDIPRLVAPILEGEADLVVGSRHKGGSDEWEGDISTFLRSVGSGILSLAMNYRWGAQITDCLNGFRALRQDVARELTFHAMDFDFEQHTVAQFVKHGYRHAEVATHEYAREWGHSKLPTYKKAYLFFWRLFLDIVRPPAKQKMAANYTYSRPVSAQSIDSASLR